MTATNSGFPSSIYPRGGGVSFTILILDNNVTSYGALVISNTGSLTIYKNGQDTFGNVGQGATQV